MEAEREFDRSVRNDFAFGGADSGEFADSVSAGGQHESGSQEFRDFEIKPSDLRNVQFFRFRKSVAGRHGYVRKLVEYVRLVFPDGQEAQLHDVVSKNQFISRLGLKISDLRKRYDYKDGWIERNKILADACGQRKDPVILRAVRNNGVWFAYAVVTDRFTEVRHSEVWDIVRQELQNQGLDVQSVEEFRTPKRVWKTFLLTKQTGQKVGDIVQAGIRVCNSIKATSSVIIYPFWKRLVCMNGMTSSKGIWRPATTHIGNKLDILQTVRQTLKEALDEVFGVEQLIARALEFKVNGETKLKIVEAIVRRKNFSQSAMHLMVRQVEKEPNNLWGVVNALTYTSSHLVMSDSVRVTIEQAAHSLLRGGQKSVEELLSPQPQSADEKICTLKPRCIGCSGECTQNGIRWKVLEAAKEVA